MNFVFPKWTVIVLAIGSLVCISDCIPFEEEVTLNSKQKFALDKFKILIANTNVSFTKPYMVFDLWLLKWLRASQFNVKNAYDMLTKSLEWRKRNKIDNILQERFPYFEENYPFWVDGQDYTGRPVGTADISVWDVRKAVVAGKGEEAMRYAFRTVELGITLIYDAIQNGHNVTQATIIGNLDGFNVAQHGCIPCIPLYARFVLEFERNYPGGYHRIFLINAPGAIDFLVRMLLPLASSETAEALKIFGTNRKKWQDAILEEIPASSIRPQFGGTKPYFDYEYYD